MKRVVVIGGGITGLTAALALQEAGVDYLLLEAEDRLGGKIRTDLVEGFTIEGGPDCFLAEKPWVFQLARHLGMEDRLLPTSEENKGTYVLSGGRLHKLPEGLMLMVPTRILPFALSGLISWPGKLRMAMDLVIPRRKGDADESLASFVTRRLGKEALDKIAEPLIGGIHAGDAESMSLKASFPRFLEMEAKHGSLIRAMLAARKRGAGAVTPAGSSVKPGVVQNPAVTQWPRRTYFMSFVDGLAELTGQVIANLDPMRIRLGTRVEAVKKGTAGGYLLHVEGNEPMGADAVIIATPADGAAAIVRNCDGDLANQLASIPMVSSATVTLVYRTEDVPSRLDGFGFVVPAKENRRIMAVTYTSRKWKHRVPGPEWTMLRVFVGGPQNQELVHLEDRAMLSMVKGELADLLGIKAAPVLTRIYRWVRGMPQYTMGHLDRMEAIDRLLQNLPGLYLAGGSYRGVGIGNCIDAGSRVVEQAIQYLGVRRA